MFKRNDPFFIIEEKIKNKQEILAEEALMLFKSPRIHDIAFLANLAKEQLYKKKVYYIYNRHLNYSNVCILKCHFCSYRKSKSSPEAYVFSLDDVEKRLEAMNTNKLKELHIVGGLHPGLDLNYYKDLLSFLKTKYPKIHLKAFTAVEIDYFAKQAKLSIEETLISLKESGLDSLPGGGAEIFNEAIRSQICHHKTTAERWLFIHKTAHNLKIPSTCTMLYGHIESYEDRVDHLERLRSLQKETKGFLSFIPLTYHPANNSLKNERTSIIDELKTIAISRIFLNNIPHIKAYWVMLGIPSAQIALEFGADDIDGTVIEEKIYHAAGSIMPQSLGEETLKQLIYEANRIPIERDSLYQEVSSL